MYSYVNPPLQTVKNAVKLALEEDLEFLGDLTASLITEKIMAEGCFIAKQEGIIAGTLAAIETFREVDVSLEVSFVKTDGQKVDSGEQFGFVKGSIKSILTGERVALNFLGYLSGIATTSNKYVTVAKAANPNVEIIDTRKTIPGLRSLAKAAVRAGGAKNHRANLSDGILIKDNYLSLMSMQSLVKQARLLWPYRFVEVECDNIEQVKLAIDLEVDVIMLDNMSITEAGTSIDLIRNSGKNMIIEISGGINLDNLAEFAKLGPDFISVGAITHSVKSLDISLDINSDASSC